MGKKIFTESQMLVLEANPNVLKVSNRSITYHPHFKVQAVKSSLSGKSPFRIFTQANFDLSVIGTDKPSQCLRRWKKIYSMYGEEGLFYEYRGKKRDDIENDHTYKEKLKCAEKRIVQLEEELLYYKKLLEIRTTSPKRSNRHPRTSNEYEQPSFRALKMHNY